MCKVSVIVPVYNVCDYIDQCIDSIVGQTFQDIEVLLIIGKSTDGSTEKCMEWAQKDRRIRVIEELQPGLGPARNQGVSIARGEYVVFIDSDDWIHEQYIEKLYSAIVKENADMAECDYYRIRNYSDKYDYRLSTAELKRSYTKEEKLVLGSVVAWKIMIKKDILIDNAIDFPNLLAEDFATYGRCLAYVNQVANVNEGLYYYRRDRLNNLMSTSSTDKKNVLSYTKTVDFLMKELMSRGILQNNIKGYAAYLRLWLSKWLSMSIGSLTIDDSRICRTSFWKKYEEYFPNVPIKKSMLMGGFNLTRIINKLQVMEDPYMRVQFSSIIALMSEHHTNYEVSHKNKYRAYMLKREFYGDFEEFLREEKSEYFYFDLIEERHDIVQVGKTYYTKSDAFDEATIMGMDEFEIIRRVDEKCTLLWKQSFDKFINLLCQYIQPQNIFVVENYLAEQHGDGSYIKEYENVEEIRRMNCVLKEYYSYIRENYPKIQMVEAYKVEQYYTSDKYEYGCYPWHLNEWANICIAKQIEERVE